MLQNFPEAMLRICPGYKTRRPHGSVALSVKTGASYQLVVRSSQSKADGLAHFREELINPGSHDVS
ncbi:MULTISPECIES: hypothetical protein [unclassified Klebsiella]|uniref:hypothetical protein n=1 Tax=unclassified Klebsiella TaxID=2608929 RepID=UPI003FA35482